jgi:transcriptional regulator with XRE-family HTH domain
VSAARGLAHARERPAGRHPELADRQLRLVRGEGRSNAVLAVAGRLVFRSPRRREGVARLEALAHVLRAVRRRAELAARAGVTVDTISRLETGRGTRPYPSTRRRIAEALGAAVADVDELRGNGAEPLATA